MTTNLALSLPIDLPSRTSRPDEHERAHRRPELVEVAPTRAQRRARPRIVAAVVGVAALGALLLAQLGISMVLSQGAYTLNALQAQQTELSRSQQALDEQLDVLKSPQNLAKNAQALGMIANTTPVYLDPKTGQVFGTPTPASASDSTANTANQVANQLLDGIGVVAKPGDTATSAEQKSASASTTGASATTTGAASTSTSTSTSTGTTTGSGDSSASSAGSSASSVASNSNQLQAPTTR
jgi:hypothetical protein